MSNYWERNADRRPIRTFFIFALVVLAVFAVLGTIGWGIVTGFSFFKGQGDAYRDKNSAQNWITAQRSFHQDQNDVTGYAAKIQQTRNELETFDRLHTNVAVEDGLAGMTDAQSRTTMQTTLLGLEQQCVNTVNSYNTDAQSYLTMDWRDADLPPALSTNACN